MSRTTVSRLASAFAIAGVLAACAESPTTSSTAAPASELAPQDAPAFSVGASERIIPGRFIVTLREGADTRGVAREHGVAPDFVYRTVLNGFAGSISEAARSGLLRDARVERVEQDGVVTKQTTQAGATWGLDRTDERTLPLNSTYSYANTGSGVTAYIIDTGIDAGHSEFTGRISADYFDAFSDGQRGNDCDGHGTHVAGTVGGTKYGVAKSVTLVRVRVLDCNGSGSWSGVIAGIDWAASHHGAGPAVANLSLGGGASSTVDAAVDRLINDRVATAVAAGNGNQGGRAQDACKYSPARVPNAMTIGATTNTDTKTSWSNYGPCVDWFAPGSGITSAWIGSGTAETSTISGTSMASPHVAGVAALYLQSNPGASAQTVRDALYANASKGAVKNASTANNHLLYSNY